MKKLLGWNRLELSRVEQLRIFHNEMQICVSNDAKYFFSSLLNGSNNRLAQ